MLTLIKFIFVNILLWSVVYSNQAEVEVFNIGAVLSSGENIALFLQVRLIPKNTIFWVCIEINIDVL